MSADWEKKIIKVSFVLNNTVIVCALLHLNLADFFIVLYQCYLCATKVVVFAHQSKPGWTLVCWRGVAGQTQEFAGGEVTGQTQCTIALLTRC